MPIEIDYAGLRHAMTRHDPYEGPLYYLDTETGEILAVTRQTEEQAYELSDLDQAESPEIRLTWHILWRAGQPIRAFPLIRGSARSSAEPTKGVLQ